MGRKTFRRPPHNIAVQLLSLKKSSNGQGGISNRCIRWQYSIQPTPMSRVYELLLTYENKSSPKIWVISPDLKELAGGKKIPHLYSQSDIRLCLYLPNTGEWNNTKLLGDTIIPWSSLWLFFFEEWLFSGELKGGGEHPDSTPKKETPKKRKKGKL